MADTIAAICTGDAEAGIGVVRISGPMACEILGRIFAPAGGHGATRPRTVYAGSALDESGAVLDSGIAFLMKSPRSYTGEDVAEIQVHGGRIVLARLLRAALRAGARPAERGEFTRRAFLNGKMDLAQAEAVIDLVSARSEQGLRQAGRTLRGGTALALAPAREALVQALGAAEAAVDFPEEEHGGGLADAMPFIAKAKAKLEEVLAGYEAGRVARVGATIVIAGKPNAGKSSLLNSILGRKRAIVTEVPGTTRDGVEEFIEVGGVPAKIADTAGMGRAANRAEEEAATVAAEMTKGADLVLVVLDSSTPLDEADREVARAVSGVRRMAVMNKSDLPGSFTAEEAEGLVGAPAVAVSARTGDGMEGLRRAMEEQFRSAGYLSEPTIARERHREAILGAIRALERAEGAGEYPELAAEDLREALSKLKEISGEVTTEELLDSIFSKFCIGK